MEFHVSRALRERLDLDELLFSYTGNIVFGNLAASRRLAKQINDARAQKTGSAGTVNAGALFAMGLIDELSHAMVARYRKEIDPAVLSDALRWFKEKVQPNQVEQLLLVFTEQFPNVAVYRGDVTAAEWLEGTTEGMPNREAALEELLLLWLANTNSAFAPFLDLFEDTKLQQETIYKTVTSEFRDYFVTRPPVAPEVGSLLDALRAPMLAAPGSLAGQLDFIREHWAKYLGDDLRRVLLATDVLREEDIAIWMRFHPPSPDRGRHGEHGWEAHGFVGDEYVGFDEDFVVGPDGVRRPRRYSSDHQAPLNEYEAFSTDQAWMPTVVLMAKSTYVWLEQLSKKYQRHIHRLDQIPDEELKLLANRGMTGLWLIGLWERSTASQTIKRLRGQSDAVASAYSLKEYRIAEDLGGTAAYEHLRDRAGRYGIRLASDMVPNHMGIDSTWVIEHPEWFISRPDSPFPSYSFEGPNLSNDSRAEIKIDDHYYDQTDAAVAFRLRNRYGNTRYVYHGNDGTTFAWNDTAQLDYSKAEVREHVIQTILQVARLFPIIRFDAAMTLAKRHVQRLWFPLPGVGGSIPSRAESAMSQEQFDALMPNEFWREVVDRVAAEVPGTLLLAEAFWLLEGYFVRTLGMHRVYNSAFMNMLRDEENAKYRSYLKKTIEFDPDILKRYVNFMSNPDERTAADQFGTGDKYFGTCTLLATLPGLPMFAHGQIEGLTERYGMDFKQARMDEHPNEGLIARHQHEIAPLLKNRRIFAESTNFVLYDFWTDYGTVDENVFAYSNRFEDQRALVLYNNRYGSTHGTIHISAASMDKSSGHLVWRSLSDGLGLSSDSSVIIAYRDAVHDLEYLRRATDLKHHGLSFDLRGYGYVVLQNWRELWGSAEQPWDKLCDALNGAGVYSIEDALSKLRLRPLHEALRQAISDDNLHAFATVARELLEKKSRHTDAQFPKPEQPFFDPRLQSFLQKGKTFCERVTAANDDGEGMRNLPAHAVSEASSEWRDGAIAAAAVRLPLFGLQLSEAWPVAARDVLLLQPTLGNQEKFWAPVLAWIILSSLPENGDRLAQFDRLQLRAALAEIFSSVGIEGEEAWRAAARVRILLFLADTPLITALQSNVFWSDPDVRWAAGVSEAFGTLFLNKEHFEELVTWLQLPALLQIAQQNPGDVQDIVEVETLVSDACRIAGETGYNLEKFLSSWKPKRQLGQQTTAHESIRVHRMPYGAETTSDGQVRFRLWAPAAKSIRLAIEGKDESLAMNSIGEGWHELITAAAHPGTRYSYILPNDMNVADPASRFQPEDVHGPSEVIDPSSYGWQDGNWKGIAWDKTILYELHVGSFTEEGTFLAAIDKLDHLVELGVTGIEIMPVADFPGQRNWGYDGVLFYAPDSAYGRPEDFKALIEAAHARGIMVILDVVYNHFGPDGNYMSTYAPQIFTSRHKTPWGDAVNYDGEDSKPVREFVIHNALYWIEEFHLDGLRLDAVHAIKDDSPKQLLDELAERVRASAVDRTIHLILENGNNQASLLTPDDEGQPKHYTAQWNDDMHHVLHTAATLEENGYYMDYKDDTEKLGRTLAEGFAFQGEVMDYRQSSRGEPSAFLPPEAFVAFMQNHDQIGNRAFGERINKIASPEAVHAIAAVYLLLPQIPMLFMGEEWGSSQPFPFFCDFHGELGELVRKGRREEFASFPEFRDPEQRERIPDPQAEETFLAAKLDWKQIEEEVHRDWLAWYKRILSVRQKIVVPLLSRISGHSGSYDVLGSGAVVVRWKLDGGGKLVLAANLSDDSTDGFPSNGGQVFWNEGPEPADSRFRPWSVRWWIEERD